MGSKYLVKSSVIIAWWAFAGVSLGQISDLAKPSPATIPEPESKDPLGDSLNRMKGERAKRDGKPAVVDDGPNYLDRHLAAAALDPHPMKFWLDVSLIQPIVITRGDRSNYTADVTSHVLGNFRINPDKPTNIPQLWTGFRLAPFAGSGTYKNSTGRYGFLYFGPMIGLGSFDLALAPSESPFESKTAGGSDKAAKPKVNVRTGWIVNGGLALQSRIGRLDATVEDPGDDFDTKKLAFDIPGLWAEARYFRLYYNALSFSGIAGAQAGKGKYFFWIGIGAGGIY